MKKNTPGSKEYKLPRHIDEALADSYEPIRAWDPPKFDALVQENIEFVLGEIPEHTKDGCPVDFILSGAYEAELNRLMQKKWKPQSKTLFEGAAMLVAMQEVYKQRN
jgi:hypothetical protein